MQNALEFLLISITFFGLGFFSSSDGKKSATKEAIQKTQSYFKKSKKIKPGVLPFRTQEDIELEKSGDKALEREWIRSGISDLIKK